MSEATANEPAPAETEKNGLLFHLRRAFAMSGAMLTALIALFSGGLALIFQLRPDLTPDPRTHLGATAEVFSVDQDVTLQRFLDRRSAIISPSEYTHERNLYVSQARSDSGVDGSSVLTLPGEDILVRTVVEGFKSRSIAMLASMYDATTGKRVPQLSDVPVFKQELDSPSDGSVVEFWLPAPPVSVTKYFVRVQIYHRNDGVLLAVADSQFITPT